VNRPYEPRRAPRYENLTVRGLRHRVTWWGERTDSPIVLLHGFMDCGATWQFLVDALPPDWCLAAPDWRGFGESEWPAEGYWFPDYLADLERLLEELAPRGQARLIGHSMGANIALLYGGIRPERLAWIVSVEGFGLQRTIAEDAPARYAKWLDELLQPARERRYGSITELAGLLQMRNPKLPPERAQFVAQAWSRPVHGQSPEHDQDRASAATGVELRFDPRHRLVNPVLYRREEAEACWARIQAPVLLVRGDTNEKRSVALRAAAADMGMHIRNLELVTVPGAGHMLQHEAPEMLARHLVEFARRQTGATLS
jgi:pimeloyl-ACP methyl ester carboxylesterase